MYASIIYVVPFAHWSYFNKVYHASIFLLQREYEKENPSASFEVPTSVEETYIDRQIDAVLATDWKKTLCTKPGEFCNLSNVEFTSFKYWHDNMALKSWLRDIFVF